MNILSAHCIAFWVSSVWERASAGIRPVYARARAVVVYDRVRAQLERCE